MVVIDGVAAAERLGDEDGGAGGERDAVAVRDRGHLDVAGERPGLAGHHARSLRRWPCAPPSSAAFIVCQAARRTSRASGTRGRPRRPRACRARPRRRPPSTGRPVTSSWKRSKSASASASVLPLSALGHHRGRGGRDRAARCPGSWRPARRRPRRAGRRSRGRRRAGCSPRRCGSRPRSSRKFRGRLQWSRMTSWYSSRRSCSSRTSPGPCGCRAASASSSSRVLKQASEARVVAGMPKRSITGCAQWWPVRTAMPSWSSTVPTSCGWTPSSTNESTPAFSRAVPTSRRPGHRRESARVAVARAGRARARRSRRGRRRAT